MNQIVPQLSSLGWVQPLSKSNLLRKISDWILILVDNFLETENEKEFQQILNPNRIY